MAKSDWHAPRAPEERARLRAKADKRWPHPIGTAVTYYPIRHRDGRFEGTPFETKTRSVCFYDPNAEHVVFVDDKSGYVLASHLKLRQDDAER